MKDAMKNGPSENSFGPVPSKKNPTVAQSDSNLNKEISRQMAAPPSNLRRNSKVKENDADAR